MVKILFLQITLYLVACNVLCLHASGFSSEKYSQKKSESGENGSKLTQETESDSNDCQGIPKVEELVNNLRSKLGAFPEAQKRLDELTIQLEEQKDTKKDSCKSKPGKIAFEEVAKFLTTTKNSIGKFRSKDSLKILEGVLDVVSSLENLVDVGQPYRVIIQTFWRVVGWLLIESKPNQSVVDQLKNFVHDEIIRFNRRLLDQKYSGLKRRISEQIFQLQRMKEGEKLDDPNLWNDYVQFLGELEDRFESPLPFNISNNLTENPDVEDFVTAVVKYSEAHSLYMALLVAAKAKYTDLKIMHEDDIAIVDRRIIFQRKDAREKLSFLSEEKYLTFLGRIEGGKLTKIVALGRRIRDRHVVETVRRSLGLSPMPHLLTIESSAKKVDTQVVTLRSVENCNWFLYKYFSYRLFIQFINNVDLPMKINSGEKGWSQENKLEFVQNISPYSKYHREILHPAFSTGGYITLNFNNIQRVIEFAVSFVFYDSKISMQDKTETEFSRGLDAYNKRSEDAVTLYFSEDGKYYIVKAEIFVCWPDRIWRFIIQDFDPEAVGE